MTLRTAKGNKPITITSWCIVFPHNGGTMVQVMGERIHLVNGYEETLQKLGLTDSGANQQHAQALEPPMENSGGGARERVNMSIECNGHSIAIDPKCDIAVAQSVMRDDNCRKIIAHYVEQYELYHGRLPSYINDRSMGKIYKHRNQSDIVIQVLTWHFNSNHRRAMYFRTEGMWDAAVSLKELEQNYQYILEEQTRTSQETEGTGLPTLKFDGEGNLI